MRRTPGLKNRGGIWHGRWHDASGKRRSKALGPRHDEASRALAEIKRNVIRARVGLEDEIGQERQVAGFLAEYLKTRDWQPKYRVEATAALNEMLAGIDRVADLTPAAVERARDRLEGSARTKNKKATWVAGFARWLKKTGRARPPLEAVIPLPPKVVRHRRGLTEDEARKLQEAADKGHVGDLVAVLLGTGLRLDEALRLTWGDVGGGIHVAESKNGESRTVPIASELRVRLARLRLQRGAQDEGRIFLSPRSGNPMTSRSANSRLLDWFREAIVESGIPAKGVDFHALRHTYATWAADAGATAVQLQALMGWRVVTMADRYVHKELVDTKAVVERMAQGGSTKADAKAASVGS
jgi:integrase